MPGFRGLSLTWEWWNHSAFPSSNHALGGTVPPFRIWSRRVNPGWLALLAIRGYCAQRLPPLLCAEVHRRKSGLTHGQCTLGS